MKNRRGRWCEKLKIFDFSAGKDLTPSIRYSLFDPKPGSFGGYGSFNFSRRLWIPMGNMIRGRSCCEDLPAPSKRYSDAEGRENDRQLEYRKEVEARDEVGNANSRCSPGEKSRFDDDDVDILHLEDESVLDGEVGKRFNQMVPVPHVPKINGEIPSIEEEVSDHQRLIDRLRLYFLVENKVQGDGNCQYGVKIFVITSFKETSYIEILPRIPKSKRVIFLSFWAEVHYNSIYPEEELPEPK